MSTHVSVRVSYPERGDYNWYDALAAYAEVGCVEVAFYRPELFLQRVTMEKVLAPFARLPAEGAWLRLSPGLVSADPLQDTEINIITTCSRMPCGWVRCSGGEDMPTLSTLPDATQLAFTLELTGWESYPVDEHGEFMTGRPPEERAAAPFRKFSTEWIGYRVTLEMLGQTVLEGHGTLHNDYDWPWLLEGLEKLVAGEENELRFEPMEPDFRLRIELAPEPQWEPVEEEEEPPAPEGPRDDDLFDVYAEIDLERAARRRGYGGEGPAAHLVLERAELRRFLEELQVEHAALGQPPEGLVSRYSATDRQRISG